LSDEKHDRKKSVDTVPLVITVKEVGLDYDMHVVTTFSPDGKPKSVKGQIVASDTASDDTITS
jgi:hypothetical protein